MDFLRNINWTGSLCRKVGLGLAALLLFVLALTTHSPKVSAKKDDSSSSSDTDSSQVQQQAKYDTAYVKIDNDTVGKNSGYICLDNKDHLYEADANDMVTIYQYMFNDKGEQIMSTSSTAICGTQEMMEHLNAMVGDFAAQTGLKTIMVTNSTYLVDGKLYMTQYDVPDEGESDKEKTGNTTAGSLSSNGCYEHLTGLAIDLQLYDASTGTYPEYTGEGQYAWINENCWKYGFVLRYPADKQEVTGVEGKKNHYRYVGPVYAQIMHENGLALEELYGFIDKYTYEKPLTVNTPDGNSYIVYSAELEKDKTSTTVPLPDMGNGGDTAKCFSAIDNGRVYVCAFVSDVSDFTGGTQMSSQPPETPKTE